jgi:type II secretory ATPase GspE/PulE/Tfp pilus assembly ATPase PilB-like protein/FixJ family two-component response regulator
MSKYSELFRTVTRSESDAMPEDIGPDGPDVEEKFSLLIVDDEENVLKAVKRIFQEENYEIFTAPSGEDALDIMAKEKIHLVISDHRMPGMTGAQLLKEIKQKWPETIRIMLTGYADVQSIMGAVNEGAVYKFITKPWNDEDLRLTVSLALQQYVLIQENRKLKDITRKQQLKISNYAALLDENRGVLGNILVRAGVMGTDDLDRALKEKLPEEFLSDTILRLGITTESKIIRALQKHLRVEYVDLKEMSLAPEVVRFLPRELCERNRLIPIKLAGRQITIAMADPSDIFKCDNISIMTGLKVVPVIAGSADILLQLRKTYGNEEYEARGGDIEGLFDAEPLDEIDIVIEEEEKDLSVQELVGSSEVPPIIRIVNAVISEAVRYKASDIHIEPKTKYTLIRYRIDGMLHNKIKIPADLHPATISRIKILSKMDISERRRPQDGRITVKAGARLVDIRVSTMPTINGEKVVMRILDKNAAVRKLDELGVFPEDLENVYRLVKKPQGIIVSTGPTGSGKTTMLYSILSEMLQSTKNFETIEDPVEYFLEDASQIYIREKIGLSFASVLRSTLRQDPDVILVGEIRDYETADVAFKAALTGHMVLTTLHTNNSVASITRLIDMGIKPYLIASAMEGILAQRLVRKVCKYCSEKVSPDAKMMELLKILPAMLEGDVYKGRGCEKCNDTGYLGRTGIFEVFVMNDDFRHLISSSYKESELINMARTSGMQTLIEDGIGKVKAGITTLEELIRVVGPQTRHERRCAKCRKTIDAKFLFCPYCGAFKQNVCTHCRMPLEKDWIICPFCGGSRTENIKPDVA